MIVPLALLWSLTGGASAPHAPHDNVHDVACGPRPQGGVEIVIATSEEQKWLRSVDFGLSWTPLHGAGLELARPARVAYWPHPVAPRFVLGTDDGVWFYFPETREIRRASAGLSLPSRGGASCRITQISAGLTDTGAVVLATAAGTFYRWSESAVRWELLLDLAVSDSTAQIAIAPEFDPAAPVGPDRALAATAGGVLHVSQDGGASWQVHLQFAVPATSDRDWSITALAFAQDFRRSGIFLLGRSRDFGGSSGQGELWRSASSGAFFTLREVVDSRITALDGAIGAGARRDFFVGLDRFPDRATVASDHGVLVSRDGGVTWSDFGNAQDFLLEPPDFTVPNSWRRTVGIAASPDYAIDGVVFFGRAEGLFRTQDRGTNWRPVRVRSAAFVRGLDTGLDADGDVFAAGATYGSGTVLANLDSGATLVLPEMKSSFQDDVAVSASFREDGALATAGDNGIQFWFDPRKPPRNPFGRQGWVYGLEDVFGYARSIALSPRFDAGAEPGAELSLFWSTRSGANSPHEPMRTFASANLAQDWHEVDTLVGGRDAPFMRRLVVAETFDPAEAETREHVYGCFGDTLFALQDTRWSAIHAFERPIADLALHPDWNAIGPHLLFVVLDSAPHVALLRVTPSGAVLVKEYDAPGLEGEQIQRIAVPPDFSSRPVLYVSTFGGGVRRIDTTVTGATWERLGRDFPRTSSEPLALSPRFATDRRVVVGTADGIAVCADVPGGRWEHLLPPTTASVKDAGFVFFDPNDPANPDPARPWPWRQVPFALANARFPDVPTVGTRLAFTTHDGASVEWEGYAWQVELHTFRGPGHGSVLVEVEEARTGTLLASWSEDLAATDVASRWIELRVPGAWPGAPRPLRIRATAALDPGEVFALDAVTVHR